MSTTTTITPADPWNSPCYMARYARLKKSRLASDLRRFVRLAREMSALGHALADRLPRSEVLAAFSLDDGEAGELLARDIRGGLWAFDIAHGLVESEMPFVTMRPAKRKKKSQKSKAKVKTGETPAPVNRISGIVD